jgi:hypothetical protein
MKCTRKQVRENKLEIDTMSFESVQSFKYLGSYVNQKNTIEEEIKKTKLSMQTEKGFKVNYCQGNPN